MESVTALFVLTMTGRGVFVIQSAGDTRLVVDCKVYPVKLVGQVTITLVPEWTMASCGALPPQVAHGAVGMPS